MPNNQLPFGDKKFYYEIHVNRQIANWLTPCSYSAFCYRLLHGMNLHDAIYYPRVEYNVRDRKLTPTIQDTIRRRQVLNEENVMILDFDEMEKYLTPNQKEEMARYNMKPKKKNLWKRFISLFK